MYIVCKVDDDVPVYHLRDPMDVRLFKLAGNVFPDTTFVAPVKGNYIR